jgi:DNA-binding CsgD family transcriptional regulator
MPDARAVEGRFCGRADESARLQRWLADRIATSAGPPVLLIDGAAGVGKSALVETATGHLVGRAGVAIRRTSATPWHARPFATITGLAGTGSTGITPDVEELAAAILALGRPVVVIVEDLHWSDAGSLELFAPLIDAIASEQVAVIGMYRGDELPRSHLLRRVRAQLRQRRLLTEMALDPLPTPDVADLIGALVQGSPGPALTAAVVERTEGLPFFVEELVGALLAAGRLTVRDGIVGLVEGNSVPMPHSVRDAVALRASTLDAAARAALDVSAVLGPDVDSAVVADITGRPWPDELDNCGFLVAAGPGRRRFRHALVQEALLDELPWSRRRALHIRLADRLSGEPDCEVAVAHHLLAGRDVVRARPALAAAAAVQLRAGAYRDAAAHLTTAVKAWPTGVDEPARCDAVEQLALCWERCGEHASAIVNLRELAGVRPSADVYRRLAAQYELLGQWPLALPARESAALAFRAVGDLGNCAAERLAIANHLRSAASFQAALDTLDLVESDARAAGRADLRCLAAGLRGNALARMGRVDVGVSTVQAALAAALADGLVMPAAQIYQRLADAIEHAGNHRGALQTYEDAYDFCKAHDQAATGQLCRACATVVLFSDGWWDRALNGTRETLADPASALHARAVAAGVAGLVQALRGQAGPARAALLDSQATSTRIELVAMELLAGWGLVLLDEGAGRLEHAVRGYRHLIARCAATDERHYCVPVLQFAAVRFADAGAGSDLAATVELLADAVTRSGRAAARVALTHALAEAALTQPGGRQTGIDHLLQALRDVSDLGLPLVDALVKQRTGVALSRSDPGQATRLLRDAYLITQRLRAAPLSKRIAAELDRLGTPVTSRRDAAGLTPREGEVIRLVGAGLTNRQIAQRLHLSVRTVEMHVGNAAAALGCRTRAEAVQRLAKADQR